MNNQTRHKISITMRGRKKGATHKVKISEALKGRHLSPQHKDNISQSMKSTWKKRKGIK